MSKCKSTRRVFSREFKVRIVGRMLGGENATALARELRFSRKDLYVWRDRFLSGGPEALRGPGRPPGRAMMAPRAGPAPPSGAAASELATALRRVAELERKVGQQELELDFFRQALRQVAGARRSSAGTGVTGSTE
ncbi:MAG: transposase [Pseudomonadota bacterium]